MIDLYFVDRVSLRPGTENRSSAKLIPLSMLCQIGKVGVFLWKDDRLGSTLRIRTIVAVIQARGQGSLGG